MKKGGAAKAPRRFSDLTLSPTSQRSISGLGFDVMTPVQAAAIPLFMKHRDVLAEVSGGPRACDRALLTPM